MGRKAEKGKGKDQAAQPLDAQINDLAKSLGIADLGDLANADDDETLQKGQDDGEDDEDDEGEDDAGDDGDEDDDEALTKGLESELFDLLKSFPESGEAISASDFLKRFALVNSQVVGRLAKSQNAALEAQDRVNLFMAKSMQAVAGVLDEVMETLNAIAGHPAGTRAIRHRLGSNGNLNKSFGAGQNGGEEQVPPHKARAERVKLETALVKAIEAGELSTSAAAFFDREGSLPPGEMEILQKHMG